MDIEKEIVWATSMTGEEFQCVDASFAREQAERITKLEQALRDAKRNHATCDDPWYSCPMHPDGCADSSRDKDECTCGAEDHNAKIDRALMVK